MLWFVSIVFTDFHKYFIVYGALFCFVLCSVERDSIVEATFVDKFLLFVFFQRTPARRRVVKISIFEHVYACMYTHNESAVENLMTKHEENDTNVFY